MDVTSISLGGSTRYSLQKYKERHEYANYGEAVRALLEEATNKSLAEPSN